MVQFPNPWQTNLFPTPTIDVRRPRRRAPEPEPITEEEESNLLHGIMGALAATGNVLDLPGSSVRDIVAGENPWDQWAQDWRSPENRVSGRDLLERANLTFRDDTWSGWLGNLAGSIGTEVVLDPLPWVTGPLGTVAKGLKLGAAGTGAAKAVDVATDAAKGLEGAVEAAKAGLKRGARPASYLPTTPASIADQIRAGERGIIGLGNPFTGTQYGALGVGSEPAAKLVEALFYGAPKGLTKYTSAPVRGIRWLFSPTAGGKSTKGHGLMKSPRSGFYQKAADLAAAEDEMMQGAVLNVMPELIKSKQGLLAEYEDIAKFFKETGNEEGFSKLMLRALETQKTLPDNDDMGRLLAESLGITPGVQMPTEFGPWADRARGLMNNIHQLKDDLYEDWLELGGKGNYLHDVFARHLGRIGRRAEVTGRGTGKLERFAAKHRKELFYEYPGATVGLNELTSDPRLVDMRRMKKFVKNATTPEEKAMGQLFKRNVDEMRRWLEQHAGGPLDEATKKLMKTPEGVMDLYVQEKYFIPHLDDAFERQGGLITILDDVGEEQFLTKEDVIAKWLNPTIRNGKNYGSRLQKLRRYTNRLDPSFRHKGVFSEDFVHAWQDYMVSYAQKAATLRGLHKSLLDPGILHMQEQAGDVLLSTAWKDAKLTPRGLETLLDSAKQQGLLPLGDVAKDLKGIYVAPEVAETIKAVVGFTDDRVLRETNQFAKGWDKVLAFYRGALIARPSFNVRNAFSGLFQEASDGKVPFTALLRGHGEMVQYLIDPSKKPEYFDEIIENVVKPGATRITEQTPDELAAAMRVVPEGGMKGIFKEPFQGDWRYRADPTRWRGVRAKPEGMVPGSKDDLFFLAHLSENLYNATEFMLRGGYYSALRKADFDPAAATHLVERAHFNYSKVSEFHNAAVKRLFLFATWKRKSIPYTLQKIAERPGGRTAQAIRLATIAQRDQESGGAYIPSFLREHMAVPFPGTDPRNQSFAVQSGFPIEDLNTVVFRETPGATVQRTGQKILSEAVSPVVSGLESLFGKQLWTGRPLKYLESKYGAPMIDRIIRASPFSAIESTVQGMLDERKSLPMRLGNMLTGFKTSTYDTEKWKLLDAIEQARRELQASPYTRELPIDYIPERFQDIAPEEVQRKLRRKRELERLRSALAVD